ncbi:MAG: SDR family oxidoreductase [Candidatus Saccharimonas sp.]
MKYTKCAIITGAGRGLGRLIAIRLARDYPVVLIGRTGVPLQTTRSLIEAKDGRAEAICGDVRDKSTLDACLALLAQNRYTPEVLICNAGIGKSSKTHEVPANDWAAVLATNLTSVHSWSSAVIPSMIAQHHGTICLIGSVAGLRGIAYDSAYTASKHALVGLGKSMALEYGKHGIAVQILCPGFIEGAMTDRSITSLAARKGITTDEARSIIAKQSPLREILRSEDVAETVAYLCTTPGRQLSGNPIILGGTA